MVLLCLSKLLLYFWRQWDPTVHFLRIETELSKKLTDCLRERKERGNEKRLSCWALADECVLSHYSHTAQYAGQSGDNECSVWNLAFLPPSCLSGLLSLLYPLSVFALVQCRVFYSIFSFHGFNYLAISPSSVQECQAVKRCHRLVCETMKMLSFLSLFSLIKYWLKACGT